MTHHDWLIVGAGLTGAVLAERIASELEQSVLLIDKRPHIGGNTFDFLEDGLMVHRYGPHIFHTNSSTIWNYLSRFTEWRPYYHHVLGMVDGKTVPVPFNLTSIDGLFPTGLATRLSDALIERFGFGSRVPILKLLKEENDELRFLADYIYAKVFRGYTLKQWGVGPEDLSASVTSRVPIVVSRDDRYFHDRYQAMPKNGYTAMVRNMIANPLIEVRLGCEFKDVGFEGRYDRIVYTGPIDEFFGLSHGPLPYRSLRFERERVPRHLGLPVGTINYPNEFDFTRVTDQRHLGGLFDVEPLLITEYPESYTIGINEPYYPMPSEASERLLGLYREDAKRISDRVLFAGRLGDYAYYNMDQACARALTLFERCISRPSGISDRFDTGQATSDASFRVT